MHNNKKEFVMRETKMKYKFWILSFLIMITLFFFVQENRPQRNQSVPKFSLGMASAFGGAGRVCETIIQNAVAGDPPLNTYAEPMLDHIHRALYRFNRIETSDIEMLFCHLVFRLGLDADLENLPQTSTKTTKDGHTVTLYVSVPTEAFATTNGYTAKAEISFDGALFLSLWWSGSDDSSKGFLIQGANPIETDGNTRLKYLLWDRSSSSQAVKILATQFANSYLNDPAASDTSKSGGDRAIYARATYDPSTKAVTGQGVEIRQALLAPNAFVCLRAMFAGTIGGTMSGYRPLSGIAEAVTNTSTDGSNMEGGVDIEDSKTATFETSGSVDLAPATLPAPFDYSCSQINSAGQAGGAFQNNTVNFSADPNTIFPN
jgi:hypothetical protein